MNRTMAYCEESSPEGVAVASEETAVVSLGEHTVAPLMAYSTETFVPLGFVLGPAVVSAQ